MMRAAEIHKGKGTVKTANNYRGKKAQNPQQGGYGIMKLSRYEQETVITMQGNRPQRSTQGIRRL